MTKRVCESCRHFQAAGFDNMGWCNHPKRKTASDLRILVRAGQLPCRDDWDHDLWQQRIAGDEQLADDVAAGPVQPATLDQIEFLAAIDRRPKPAQPELGVAAEGVDVVVGETTAMREPPERPAGRVEYDRSTVRRAHEQYRARKREQRSLLAPSFEADPVRGDRPAETPAAALDAWLQEPIQGAEPGAEGGHSLSVETPAATVIDDLPRPGALPVEPLDGDNRFTTVPKVRIDVDLPLIGQAAQGYDAAPPAAEAESERVPCTPPASRSVWGDDGIADRRQIAQTPRADQHTAGHDANADVRTFLRHAPDLDDDDAFEVEFPAPIVAPRTAVEQRARAVVHAPVVTDSDDRFDGVDDGEESVDVRRDSEHEATDVTVLDPRAAVIAMWADVPRVCRTCRDFRPAESGERGWCTNKWAFSHRRMVDADEQPCETTIGGWWLPHDDLWLSSVDVSAHSHATPLVDLWQAHRRSSEVEATPVRRRRRS